MTDQNLVHNPHQLPDQIRLVDIDSTYVATRQQVVNRIRETQLDLYTINDRAEPPVYKLLDYGKFRFDQQKKDREQKRRLREMNRPIKEFKFKPQIDEHDVDVKIHHIRDNLIDHDVKIFMELKRGNAIVLTERWKRRIPEVAADPAFVLNRVVRSLDGFIMPSKMVITDNQIFMILKRPNEDLPA